ncbi:carbohydrate ABC transporter permease [Cohnella hashimotonis]|uniref:Carbohydrate ABC transporter permease n=1 Tax=Cohnella hashimotonis TaxID=2826895 RepID=A0ABT6TA37_9BACL|nr:carbohydrate ABC transporter permease [Cohnella hashimotonis]MDI4643698.1 carbohydrate ABC transporter permease [Cohnella hashimotonis]
MVLSSRFGDRLGQWIIDGLLILIALLCLAPLLHVVALSFSDKAAAAAGNVTFLPVDFTTSSYRLLLKDRLFFASFVTSVERVILGGGLNFMLTLLMAYPLSRDVKQFKLRHLYTWSILFTMLFSGGLIPWYMTVKTVGILDTIWALVLPGAVPVFSVVLLMNFFRSIPRDLDEAGTVDGAGPWYMLFFVYLPISLPAIATVTLFSIVGHWNSFFDGLMLMNKPEHYPLQTYIQQLVVQKMNDAMSDADSRQLLSQISDRTLNAAKIFVSMVPILFVYPFLQRFFVHGIILGSVKE